MCLVNVVDGAITQAVDGRIIFLAGNVVVRLVEQFQGAVKSAAVIHVRIDRRMVIQVFTIINGGVLDLADGFVDFFDGMLLFVIHVVGRRQLAQVGAGVAQVGKSMQVGGMPSRFVSESKSSADSNKEYEYGTKTCAFHGLLEPCGGIHG